MGRYVTPGNIDEGCCVIKLTNQDVAYLAQGLGFNVQKMDSCHYIILEGVSIDQVNGICGMIGEQAQRLRLECPRRKPRY